jgi:hypothetical protein
MLAFSFVFHIMYHGRRVSRRRLRALSILSFPFHLPSRCELDDVIPCLMSVPRSSKAAASAAGRVDGWMECLSRDLRDFSVISMSESHVLEPIVVQYSGEAVTSRGAASG